MLELDAILIPYFDKKYESLNQNQKQQLENLLKSEDQDLYNWLMGKKPPTNEHKTTINEIIKTHHTP